MDKKKIFLNKKGEEGCNRELIFSLNFVKDVMLKNKFDAWMIITGSVGAGKSTFASQVSEYLNIGENDLKYCCFSGDQLIEAINTAPKGSVIIYDESITSLASNSSMTKMARNLQKVAVQCRSKELIVLLLLPNISLLNKYFVSRCACMFDVYHQGYRTRGYGRFYNKPRMAKLYYYANYIYKYNPESAFKVVNPNWRFYFRKKFYFNEQEYEDKKQKGMEESTVENDRELTNKKKVYELVKMLKDYGHSQKDISSKLGITINQLRTLIGTKD